MSILSQRIKHEAETLGFSAVGIARVSAPPEISEHVPQDRCQEGKSFSSRLFHVLREWLTRGFHGTMDWMAKEPKRRSDPRAVLPGCRSIICVGMNYFTNNEADEGPGNGRIARYAWGEDYHRVLTQRLRDLENRIRDVAPAAQTRSYVDTGPIMEKAWAQEAGLGWIGKHSNLVSPQFGSWLLLGEILTTLELDADEPGTDLCGSCSLCIRACPTHAIPEPYVLDATKCISYLTIEFRGNGDDIPEELRRKMGNRIFGCDDCLDACPYNVYAAPTDEPAFQPRPVTLRPDLTMLSTINEQKFSDTFRGSPVRRAKFAGFQRNLRLALANQPKKSPSILESP